MVRQNGRRSAQPTWGWSGSGVKCGFVTLEATVAAPRRAKPKGTHLVRMSRVSLCYYFLLKEFPYDPRNRCRFRNRIGRRVRH
jgi:hypothetical protein